MSALTRRRNRRTVNYDPFGVRRRDSHRGAWTARGVDNGTDAENTAAAERLGIEWPQQAVTR